MRKISIPTLIMVCLGGCGESAKLPLTAGMGPTPELPAPVQTLLPTVNVAPAKGWPPEEKPIAATGFTVQAFADQLDHPRWIYVLPNGDVLIAETNAPPRPDDANGIKGWFATLFMKKAGAHTPSANRITLLRDNNRDGVADLRTNFLEHLNSPFGMALVDNTFYVANTDNVMAFPYRQGQTQISSNGLKLVDLPAGTINHHWTKNLIASADGSKLYVSVGSNSNIAERGMDQEIGRAAIWEIDRATGKYRIFASGLRNPVGMAWEPTTGKLWATVNERDELGSDLVPDYMTSVQEGGFYGWPFSYFGQHVDVRVTPPMPGIVEKAIMPDYALGSHTASLGLCNTKGSRFPAPFDNGFFVGQHGSWNRKPHSGYEVIFIPFSNGQPEGLPQKVLSGFLDKKGNAKGRPVGVAIDTQGGLLVADDVGNVIWRVTARDTE